MSDSEPVDPAQRFRGDIAAIVEIYDDKIAPDDMELALQEMAQDQRERFEADFEVPR
jgi:hypothetical protein